MFRHIGFGAAAVLVAGALAVGCSDDGGDDITIGGSDEVTSASDAIATRPSASHATNEQSINPGHPESVGNVKVFRFANGAGLMAYSQGDDGDERLYLQQHGPSGPMGEPHRVDADVNAAGYGNSVASMVAVQTPRGIVVAFEATQDAVVNSATDAPSDRIYVLSFTQATGWTTPTAVDTNSSPANTDDNAVDGLFVATNLIDGTLTFTGAGNDLEEHTSGPKGDSATNLTPFVYIGWLNLNSTGARRIEGAFIDLDVDTHDVGTVSAINLPTVDGAENVTNLVWTSGRDMLFHATDATSTPAEDHLFLVRLNGAAGSVGTPIDIDRGDSINAGAYTIDTDSVLLIGDGFRPYNGVSDTFIFFLDALHEDATATQADADFMAAQVDGTTNTVEIAEFDHNAENAAAGLAITDVDYDAERSAVAVYVFLRQVHSTTNSTNDALFARVVRFDPTQTLANNVSAEIQINAANDADNDGDADVLDVITFDADPLCSNDPNNEGHFVAYTQDVDEDTTGNSGVTLRGRGFTTDLTVDPPAITLGTETIFVANADPTWPASFTNFRPILLQSNDPAGDSGIIFFVINGNNPDDNTTSTTRFDEPRALVASPELATAVSGTTISVQALAPTEIGTASTATQVPFDHWNAVTLNGGLHALALPEQTAQRDFTLDEDVLTPTVAYFIIPEFVGDNDSEDGETYVARHLDLTIRPFAAAVDRVLPPVADLPFQVGTTDAEFDDLSTNYAELLPSGTGAVFVFNNEQADDTTNGRLWINTGSLNGWRTAALLSTDDENSISDHGNGGFNAATDEVAVIPGVTGFNCETAVGFWVFWVREVKTDDSSDPSVQIEGRHGTGGSLSN